MSERDGSQPPGSPKKQAAPPRPGPPALEANPFLARESSREVDAGWPEAPSEPTPLPHVAAPPQIAVPPPTPIARVEQAEQAPVAPGGPNAQPVRKRSRAKVIALVLFSVSVLVGGGLAYRRGTARSPKVERAALPSSADETARVEPPTPTAEPVPPPTFTAQTPPSASAAKKPATGAGAAGAGAGAAAALSADPSKTGIVDTTPLPAGRKIVVDGRMIGTSPGRFVVRCGAHRFQIGDLPPETLNLPCGGEISFSD